ncbi:MAG: PqqD family peptide modification chaperone [Syntrophobacter sp.]
MSCYALRKDVVYRKEADGALIYDHSTGRVIPLNGTAAFMCDSLLIEHHGVEEVLNGIKKRWRVSDEELVRSDIEKFLIGMKNLNLIEEVQTEEVQS